MSHTAPSVPGPRPHPSLISFAPECFVTDGTREEYSVLNPFGRGGPEKFGTDLAAATKHALRCGREVETHVAPVLRRVRWTVSA